MVKANAGNASSTQKDEGRVARNEEFSKPEKGHDLAMWCRLGGVNTETKKRVPGGGWIVLGGKSRVKGPKPGAGPVQIKSD
jgi:hypothetical protein